MAQTPVYAQWNLVGDAGRREGWWRVDCDRLELAVQVVSCGRLLKVLPEYKCKLKAMSYSHY